MMMEEGRIEQGLSQEQQLGDDGSDVVFKIALWGMYLVAALMFFGVTRITAPFGRHTRRGWGPSMPAREAWIVMESPALFVMALVYYRGQHHQDVVPLLLLRLFQLHYIHRCLVYPFRIRNDGKVMPILVCFIGFLFNVHNAYLQASWISHYGDYAASWLTSPQFMLGALLFLLGFGVNIWADSVLLNLRTDGRDKSYKIPRGFLYEYVTCPNYLGEIVEWFGWGVMTNSWAGFSFFLCTLANLAPRAAVHHQWYLKKFSDYPSSRKTLIPFVY